MHDATAVNVGSFKSKMIITGTKSADGNAKDLSN